MTVSRAAPGPQLSAGRLRVDAARAIAKLREYQLVDRSAWILEAIRAAVASGATKMTLSGDANDVWLAWDGPAWPVEELPRLFDELVSPEPLEERHHLRLLAAAINSALGIVPAYVDIYTVQSGEAHRARYTPDVLDEPTGDLEDSPLRRIAAVPAPVPAGIAPETGMLVHLRRRAALGMLTYLFWEREPPELATARLACRDIGVPLQIGSVTLHRDRHGEDVLRLPLGDGLDGFVAVVDPKVLRPGQREPELAVAERGVVLATYAIALAPIAREGEELRAPVPLRVVLDGKRMPTNASRSQVRRDVPPITTALERAPALATKLIAMIAEAAGGPQPDASELQGEQALLERERARRAAIAMIASVLGGLQWSAAIGKLQLGPLARLPLLTDAGGIPRPIAYDWSGLIYTGRKPLPEDIAAWVPGMLWVRPGDPAAAILAGATIDSAETKRQLKAAKQMRRSHRGFFRHPACEATLALGQDVARARMALGAAVPGSCVPDAWFTGLRGEVALTERSNGEVTVLYQGRPIERIDVDCPIGFVAVIDAPEVTPTDRYRAIARDENYARIMLAARGMVVRLVEAVALGRWQLSPPPGVVLGPGTQNGDARLTRAALGLAVELGARVQAPLTTALAWRTHDGEWIDFKTLSGLGIVGFASGVDNIEVKGRPIIVGGAWAAAKLLPATRIVDYDRQRTRDDGPLHRAERIARYLAMSHKVALAIEDDDVRGAIAPSTGASRIRLYHAGNELDTRTCIPSLFPSIALAVDADSIVPDPSWQTAADAATAVTRNYVDWELALIRAAARAFVGEPVRELIGGDHTRLDGDLGRILCFGLSLDRREPVFDDALFAKLRAAPIVHALGERELISVDELVKRFPASIPLVGKTAAPVDGFTPIVGDPQIGKAIAKLAGVPVHDGTTELEDRRRTVARDRRIAEHRAKPELELTFPLATPSIALDKGLLRVRGTGLVGLHNLSRLEIEIRIENRHFLTLTHSEGPPLYAVIDLNPIHVDATFEKLTVLTVQNLIDDVKKHVRPLLAHVAATTPAALADVGGVRGLFASWLRSGDPNRQAFVEARAFLTIDGVRTSLVSARTGNLVRTATYDGEWLPAAAGEPPSPLDTGVLRVPLAPNELVTIVEGLHKGPVQDVTDQVARLQTARRIARGLIRAPSLGHVDAPFKRKLSELGAAAEVLGHGEIGLVSGGATALLHVDGEFKDRVALDVLPAVHIAIEAPDLVTRSADAARIDPQGTISEQLAWLRDTTSTRSGPEKLSAAVQKLVGPLVADVLAKTDVPPSIRRSIRAAVLTCRLAIDAPVFELIDGSWVGASVVRAQISKYGQAWCVTSATTARPLDRERLVFVLSDADLVHARGSFTFLDATRELALDAEAARNRERPKARELVIAGNDDLIATTVLDGDGTTRPRGVVAPLLPRAFARRGLYPHRAMFPFEVARDPCAWPTIAVVDDARLTPDRTWSAASPDSAWHSLVANVQVASEAAFRGMIERPAEALAFARTSEGIDVRQDATFQVRGAAWLVGPPVAPPRPIEIVDSTGERGHLVSEPLGMEGILYVMGSGSINSVIRELYKLLVRRLSSTDTDLLAAHRANALWLDVLAPDEVSGTFDCFRPKPLSAAELVELFKLRRPVRVFPVAELEADLIDGDVLGVVEDGSLVSQVIIARLGNRALRKFERRKKPEPAPAPVPLQPIQSPPETRHPIQILADYIDRTLVDLGVPSYSVTIADRASPIVDYTKKGLQLAGDNERLRAVANAMHVKSPWAEAAAGAVIAHAIAVLDLAMTEVTAETHRKVLGSLLRPT